MGWKGSFNVCKLDKVKWAKGVEIAVRYAPLEECDKPFKVEWAAKWWTFGVTIEGAGKDHASAGGTLTLQEKLLKM